MCTTESEENVIVKLPGLPPSVNNSYRAARSKGAGHCLFYKKREVKKWQAMAVTKLKEASEGHCVPFTGKLKLSIACYTKNKRRMDVDNRIKAVQDCLQSSGLIKDDSQIWDLRAVRIMTEESEFTVIELSQYYEF